MSILPNIVVTHEEEQSQATAPQNSKAVLNGLVRQIGIAYWQKLVKAGVPFNEARSIAAAIAKFDVAHRQPNDEQRSLIIQHSLLICRAELWRTGLVRCQSIH